MKHLLIIVLCPSLLLEGCYSSFTLTEQDRLQGHPNEDETILVTLKNGSTIESEDYHHVEVKEPSNFIYVEVGERFDRKTGERKTFRGSIQPATIDSSRVDTVLSTGWSARKRNRLHFYNFGLTDGSVIRCLKSDCFTVTSAQGPGLWCAGRMELNHESSNFVGKIPFESIMKLEVKKVSATKTAIGVFGIALGVGVVFILLFAISFKLEFGFGK